MIILLMKKQIVRNHIKKEIVGTVEELTILSKTLLLQLYQTKELHIISYYIRTSNLNI